MTKRVMLLAAAVFSVAGVVLADDSDIHLNSLGFLPNRAKMASISATSTEFVVKRTSDDATVYSGQATGPRHQNDVGQDIWVADSEQF